MNINAPRLTGKKIIITGAGAGLGRDAAISFAAQGAHILCADLDIEAAKQTVEAIVAQGGKAVACQTDISLEEDNRQMVETAMQELGGIDGLYANAGIAGTGTAADTSKQDWDKMMAVGLTGNWLSAKYVLPQMTKQQSGVIVFQSSICSLNGFPHLAAYSAAKGALAALTRQMAVDYGSDNIRVNAIAPGTVVTELVKQTYVERLSAGKSNKKVEDSLSETASRYPLTRLGEVEDVSHMAIFLFSDESKWVSGSVFTVDGGYTAK